PGGGSGGQGISAGDQMFMGAAELFRKMDLSESEQSRALSLLEAWGDKSERIFIRMLLLPAMIDLGYPREKCVEVCTNGLHQPENYYRLQTARLLTAAGDRCPINDIDLEALLHDADVGVRIYAAKIHWHKNREAHVVVPILT